MHFGLGTSSSLFLVKLFVCHRTGGREGARVLSEGWWQCVASVRDSLVKDFEATLLQDRQTPEHTERHLALAGPPGGGHWAQESEHLLP